MWLLVTEHPVVAPTTCVHNACNKPMDAAHLQRNLICWYALSDCIIPQLCKSLIQFFTFSSLEPMSISSHTAGKKVHLQAPTKHEYLHNFHSLHATCSPSPFLRPASAEAGIETRLNYLGPPTRQPPIHGAYYPKSEESPSRKCYFILHFSAPSRKLQRLIQQPSNQGAYIENELTVVKGFVAIVHRTAVDALLSVSRKYKLVIELFPLGGPRPLYLVPSTDLHALKENDLLPPQLSRRSAYPQPQRPSLPNARTRQMSLSP